MKKSGFLFAPEYIREKVYFGVFADAFKMDVISNSALQFVPFLSLSGIYIHQSGCVMSTPALSKI